MLLTCSWLCCQALREVDGQLDVRFFGEHDRFVCNDRVSKLCRANTRFPSRARIYFVGYFLLSYIIISYCQLSHAHMLHCPPVSTSSWMMCSDRPQFVVCLESSIVFDSDRSSWRIILGPIRGNVQLYSGGSGCFPLLPPGCRNPTS